MKGHWDTVVIGKKFNRWHWSIRCDGASVAETFSGRAARAIVKGMNLAAVSTPKGKRLEAA